MNYKTQAAVTRMVTFSGLPKRSLMCRFAKATGMQPLDYIHALRLEEAKQLLETTDLPVEAIANEVGYEDTSFFGQLLRRKSEITRCSSHTVWFVAPIVHARLRCIVRQLRVRINDKPDARKCPPRPPNVLKLPDRFRPHLGHCSKNLSCSGHGVNLTALPSLSLIQ